MDANEERKGFSFDFSKIKDQKKLKTSAIKNDDKEVIEETEFVSSLEDKAVKSTKPKDEDKPLVIPMIQTNKWHLPTPEELENDTHSGYTTETAGKSHQQNVKTGDDITDQAVRELVTEANIQQSLVGGDGVRDPNRAVPLLMKNKIPEGFETDDKLDVSLRPNEAAPADYDQIPIEEYGMALLRGMGFSEGQGIGKNNKDVAPIVAVARPKGLGLGADRSLTLQQKGGDKSGDKNQQDENLVMKKGAHCLVCAGKNEGLYGVVEGIDEDNSRVVVKTVIKGNSLTLNQMVVKLVTKKDFDKNSKYLNKTKVDKFKEKEEAKRDRQHRSDSRDRDRRDNRNHTPDRHHDRHKHKHHKKDRHRDRYNSGDDSSENSPHEDRSTHREDRSHHKHERRHKHKNRSRSPLEKTSKKSKKDRDTTASKNGTFKSQWLHPYLRVRIVDPEYKKGKYYKSKVIIEDVISLDSCICKTDEGKILEGLSQKHLETVIPKTKSSRVMVVCGKHKGKIGEILEKDSSSCVAVVQILPDCDEILTLDYDVICEYTGSQLDIDSY